jgi:hypothetical protein
MPTTRGSADDNRGEIRVLENIVDKIMISIYAFSVSDKNTVHIGLKLADGTFFPVFEQDFHGSKRLVLTTVHDNQKSVQIDLYKGMGDDVFEDAYIGSLVIENLIPSKKGAAEIELVMGIDDSGNLHAQAKDPASGEQQALSVSLESLAQRSDYDIPEFDIDQPPPVQSDETITEEAYTESDGEQSRSYNVKEKKRRPLAVILIILLGLILLAAIAGAVIYFFFPSIPRQLGILPPEITAVTEPVPSPEPEPSIEPSEEPTVTEIETPAPETETEAVSESESPAPAIEEKPVASSGKGVWYTVVWGDTLWDLSRQYYRDPFQYMKIADAPENTIPNPDLIFEYQRIFIPDK